MNALALRTALAALALLLLACTDAPPAREATLTLAGMGVQPAGPKPEFTLIDTRGQPYDFREETDGHLTFLYFGYTHCPDICPVQMSTLAAALREVPAAVRRNVKVVFVTTDPARDTPEQLRSWLNAFDSSFVGLGGPLEALAQAEAASGVAPSRAEPGADSASYGVTHAAQVLAYTPDDSLRAMYLSGVTKEDWARDIRTLVARGLRR